MWDENSLFWLAVLLTGETSQSKQREVKRKERKQHNIRIHIIYFHFQRMTTTTPPTAPDAKKQKIDDHEQNNTMNNNDDEHKKSEATMIAESPDSEWPEGT